MQATESQTKILQEFQRILAEKKRWEYQVITKEEEAEKEKNKQLLAVASTYLPDTIVRNLADLQLDFGSIVTRLCDRLDTEVEKLEQLQQAIEIETQNLQQLKQVRIVADALHLLRQEQQEKLRAIENETARQQEALEKDWTQKRKAWIKEQEAFETRTQESQERLQVQRQQEEADYRYKVERQRKIESDRYEQEQRMLEKELAEQGQKKEKDWTEREQFLSTNQALFEENQAKVAGYEEALKQAYQKAKDEAIQEVSREEKVKADLVEKEWEGTQQGYEVKIAALEATIARNNEQISDLSTQLQAVTRQAQELAQRAFSSAA
jgi:hypothetical protein